MYECSKVRRRWLCKFVYWYIYVPTVGHLVLRLSPYPSQSAGRRTFTFRSSRSRVLKKFSSSRPPVCEHVSFRTFKTTLLSPLATPHSSSLSSVPCSPPPFSPIHCLTPRCAQAFRRKRSKRPSNSSTASPTLRGTKASIKIRSGHGGTSTSCQIGISWACTTSISRTEA